MMAEETIKEVIERIQARVENSQHAVGTAMIDTADIAALLAELDAVRAERDAYQEALDDALTIASNPGVFRETWADELSKVVNAALQSQTAQPARRRVAEWTPRTGMRVITSKSAADDLRDIKGTVQEEIQPRHWLVKLDRHVVGYASAVMFLESELEPIKE